jgi:hypothetical protein
MMSQYQKALGMLTPEQRQALKASGGQDEDTSAQPGGGQDSQQTDFEDGGNYIFEGGKFVPADPPQATQHSERSSRFNAPKAEPTVQDRLHEWPDISIR